MPIILLSRPRRPSGIDQRWRDGNDAGGLGCDQRPAAATAADFGTGNRGVQLRQLRRRRSLRRGQRLLAADRQRGDEVQPVEHVLDAVAAGRRPAPPSTPSARRTSAPGTVGHAAPLFVVRGQRVQRRGGDGLLHDAAHVRGNRQRASSVRSAAAASAPALVSDLGHSVSRLVGRRRVAVTRRRRRRALRGVTVGRGSAGRGGPDSCFRRDLDPGSNRKLVVGPYELGFTYCFFSLYVLLFSFRFRFRLLFYFFFFHVY